MTCDLLLLGARANSHAFDEADEPGGAALAHALPRFADDLAWRTEAERAQRGTAGAA